jgi:uncharacterized membrane protein
VENKFNQMDLEFQINHQHPMNFIVVFFIRAHAKISLLASNEITEFGLKYHLQDCLLQVQIREDTKDLASEELRTLQPPYQRKSS